MMKSESSADLARAYRIERIEHIILRDYLDDVDCADLVRDELQLNSDRSDAVIAKVIAMRIRQP